MNKPCGVIINRAGMEITRYRNILMKKGSPFCLKYLSAGKQPGFTRRGSWWRTQIPYLPNSWFQ
jgi:hypothetical protein